MKLLLTVFAGVIVLSVRAVPQLAPQAEVAANGALKIKVLAGSQGLPAPTPQAKRYRMRRGNEVTELKLYEPTELWREHELLATWKDKKGNFMRVAQVTCLPPEGGQYGISKEDFDAAMKSVESAEKPSDEQWLAAWKATGEPATRRIVAAKSGERFLIEFEFAEKVAPKDAERLLKTASASLTTQTRGASTAHTAMKWWDSETAQYKFLTDLDRAKGGKFIADAMKLMAAMRKSYEFYVPAQKPVELCKVRVFKTLAGYREYRASTGDEDDTSCGLWDPSREELLVSAENRDFAQQTMRHEAFHQYLYYSTGRGNHALWFNEGNATFFENVKYNPAKNIVRVTDEGNRAMWVGKNPERHAQHMRTLIRMDRNAYYSGDVNLNYCTGWALMYFLQKGAYTNEKFAPYRKIVPKYLERMAAGDSAQAATEAAWAEVSNRDLAADFLEFWTRNRKKALTVR